MSIDTVKPIVAAYLTPGLDIDEAMDNLYSGPYVRSENELKYEKSEFAQFEIKFLFSIFIWYNSFQAVNAVLKMVIYGSNLGNGGNKVAYKLLICIFFLELIHLLIREFPAVFWPVFWFCICPIIAFSIYTRIVKCCKAN